MHSEKNRILINAAQAGEIRVALLEENKLSDLDIEYTGQEQKKSNIYKGKISRIEPSLEAAFIDYGADRHGFLPFKEIAPSYFKFKNNDQAIKSSLKVGQEMMVQIEKEERGNKGAALTTYITLPGSYLVLMPNNPGAGGISRRIEGEERRAMQDSLSQLAVPGEMGLILRTAGVGRDLQELQNDFGLLLKQWDAIQHAFNERSAPFLVFQEGDLITRSIRDYLRRDIDEIIIDDKKIYEKIRQYIEQIRPDFLSRITLYQNPTPLFLQFNIEEAAESAFQREIRLASGGTIVIDRAEALVAIDINSGRSTKNGDIEETAIKTNLEAAKEIAHQLRVRDLGGLIVIDFIDMNSEDNKRKVENCLREATKKDRARIQIGRISAFGLLEMSRQRLRHSLGKANETLCPHCSGQGTVRSPASLALSLIRLIEKEALKKSTQQLRVELPIDMLTYLINEKRTAINQIEQRYQVTLQLIPNPYWQSPQHKITALTKSAEDKDSHVASYELLENRTRTDVSMPYAAPVARQPEVPAVKSIVLPNNKNKSKTQLGVLSRLFSMLSDLTKSKKTTPVVVAQPAKKAEHYAAKPHQERRYAKGGNRNNNNRSRPRRERGQGNRYPAANNQPTRYEQQTQAKPSAVERTPQPRRRPPERALPIEETQAVKKQHPVQPRPAPRKPIEAVEKPSIVTAPQVVPTQTQAIVTHPKPVNPTTSEKTENKAPANSALRSHRRNPRRYGGEPKLRHRNYAFEDQSSEKHHK
ncbi:Rne/Rng family ribonuclease [Rickettsiella endosymbiont of Dermanyssus gallinae]|uniref:Rne/Rng family ribonuclease n=1 Tax=Rickettsiella endosymbiont of Dermanyssus gallinae TaxID=2856608 RepID=UPI001C52D854|nr:Rne/Rng family ribonuclease [Rickettsiella endosymbiont of Dermanyssus gallinae]